MKIITWIESNFWAVLLTALIAAMLIPVGGNVLLLLLQPSLMLMLFLVFLKIDLSGLWETLSDYRLMSYINITFLLVFPMLFFIAFRYWDLELATGVLLLTAMPAGTAAPALVDMLRGNVTLALGITMTTSLLAPFTVPLLLNWLVSESIEINTWGIFRDTAVMIFVPLISAQLFKRFLPKPANRILPYIKVINISLLFIMMFVVLGSQRARVLSDPFALIEDLLFLFGLFTVLHLIGWVLGWKQSREDRIAILVGHAYMNNGLGIVLAAAYFSPAIILFMTITELPWNTMLIPLQGLLKRKKKETAVGQPVE